VQPDPAANDLDALVAQAAAVTPTGSGSSSGSSTWNSAADVALPAPIYSVPAADRPTKAAATAQLAATHAGAERQPRYTAVDKLHLTSEAAEDIARRLRKAGSPKLGQPVLRVFR
jgi:hypothetical protein